MKNTSLSILFVLVILLGCSGSRVLPERKAKAFELGQKGSEYLINADFYKALDVFHRSLMINEGIDNREGIAADLNNMGTVYYYMKDLDRAAQYFEEALKINEESCDLLGRAASLSNIGNVSLARGHVKEAVKKFEEALRLDERSGNREGAAVRLNNLGLAYNSAGNRDKALRLYQKALSINEREGNTRGMANNLSNMGRVYEAGGELRPAIEYYMMALRIDKEIECRPGIGMDLYNIGHVYESMGKLKKALNFYERGRKVDDKLEIRGRVDKNLEGVERVKRAMGNCSYLAFSKGSNWEKAACESDRGIYSTVRPPTLGVPLKAIQSLPEIISCVANMAIVYVGEKHDRYADHLMQMEVIKGLHQYNSKLAVGMEMFQRPYQTALDDYISGKIDEKAFLRESHYFATWRFNYYLYRQILQYARDFNLPVIALNMDHKVVKKVSRKGIKGLTTEERDLVPQGMDFSDAEYKARLRSVFAQHREQFSDRNAPTTFDNFYETQVLWDETMAESIQRFLAKNPGYQMVVLAGNGHLSYGSGIPKRAYRRTREAYSVILPDPQVPLETGLADFVVFPNAEDVQEPPKLMVVVETKDGSLKIVDFLPGSGAKEGGMKKGDIILAVDNQRVEDLETLRIILFARKDGDTTLVKVRRGEREMELPVIVKVPSKSR